MSAVLIDTPPPPRSNSPSPPIPPAALPANFTLDPPIIENNPALVFPLPSIDSSIFQDLKPVNSLQTCLCSRCHHYRLFPPPAGPRVKNPHSLEDTTGFRLSRKETGSLPFAEEADTDTLEESESYYVTDEKIESILVQKEVALESQKVLEPVEERNEVGKWYQTSYYPGSNYVVERGGLEQQYTPQEQHGENRMSVDGDFAAEGEGERKGEGYYEEYHEEYHEEGEQQQQGGDETEGEYHEAYQEQGHHTEYHAEYHTGYHAGYHQQRYQEQYHEQRYQTTGYHREQIQSYQPAQYPPTVEYPDIDTEIDTDIDTDIEMDEDGEYEDEDWEEDEDEYQEDTDHEEAAEDTVDEDATVVDHEAEDHRATHQVSHDEMNEWNGIVSELNPL